jgi:uncharacterized protein YcbX
VHVLTTATLDRLRELYPHGRFELRRFRPNLVVDVADEGSDFVENGCVGRTLVLGDGVRLHISGPCPRCVMTTLAQADLPKDPGILRTAARYNQANVGVWSCRAALCIAETRSGWRRTDPHLRPADRRDE